jgi:hypothetical protein
MRRFQVYDGHASIEIPAGWNEMPAELLEFLSTRTAELSGGRITEYYQYGFRPAATESGFELPQVLIQIRENGRLPLSQFVNLPSFDEVDAESPGLLRDQRGPFLQRMELDGLSFDAGRTCLRVNSTMDLLVEGTTAVRSASFLTERGVFVVHCYDHASRMASSAALFDRIISSVNFDEHTAYRVRWSDRWTGRHTSVVVFIAAVCLGLIVVALRRDRRRTGFSTGGGPAPPSSP